MPTYIRVKDLPNAATSPAADDFILLSGAANGARRISRADFLSAVAGFYTADPSTYKLATLDAGDKVLVSQLPSSAFSYQGTWAASTNTPTLANGTGTGGDTYYASDSGSVNFGAGSISFLAGDAVVYDGSVWQKVPDVVNLLDGKGTLDEAKTTLKIPDVGTAPNETPLNQHLGSLAYADADSVSVDDLEVTGKLDIDSSGNVSIGAGDVANNGSLHVYRSSATADLNLQSAGGSGRSYALQSKADGNLVIRDNNAAADRCTIDSSGRVGIGTTSPDQLIHASSSTGASLRLERDSVTITSGQSYGAVEWEGQDASGGGAASGVRAKIETEATSTSGAVALKFYTAAGNDVATERWRIDSSGNLVANSTGIDFGSGATLNDYEEGVHTTTATPGVSGSITLSSTDDTFAYTKIGRSIIVTGILKVDSVSSPTGPSLYFTLPTSTLNLSDNSGGFGSSVSFYDNSTGAWSVKPCSAGESTNNLFVNMDASTVAANDQFRIMVCYQSA